MLIVMIVINTALFTRFFFSFCSLLAAVWPINLLLNNHCLLIYKSLYFLVVQSWLKSLYKKRVLGYTIFTINTQRNGNLNALSNKKNRFPSLLLFLNSILLFSRLVKAVQWATTYQHILLFIFIFFNSHIMKRKLNIQCELHLLTFLYKKY